MRSALLGILWLFAIPVMGQPVYSADAVKAALLERIVSFLDWPAKDTGAEGALRLVVLGGPTFADQLEVVFRRHPFVGRRLEVIHASELSGIGDAQILVIGANQSFRLEAILRKASQRGLLTVADSEGFAERGVAINFFREGGRVRFEISPDALKRAGIRASYKLLTLARIVGGTP